MAQSDRMRYGGETTSVLIEGRAGERVLLDLGTGARRLAARLEEPAPGGLLVLLTHYHLDHVIGLPSLPQIYREGYRIEFAAPQRQGLGAVDILPRLMAQPFWPLQLQHLDSSLVFSVLPEDGMAEPRRHGGLVIRWTGVHHEGGCTAYRIDEPAGGASLLFATDVEWPLATPAERASLLRLARTPSPVDWLCFDGNFTAEEYPRFREWGHSSWCDAIEVARTAGARRLLVVHHAPAHDDQTLAAIDREVRAAFPAGRLAVEGEEIEADA